MSTPDNALHERSESTAPFQRADNICRSIALRLAQKALADNPPRFNGPVDLTERSSIDYDPDGCEVLPGTHDINEGMDR